VGAKSPFKTLVKQQPIEADASVVPMETETNVRDDEDEMSPYIKALSPFTILKNEISQVEASDCSVKYLFVPQEVEISPIENQFSVVPDGPSSIELCEDCRARKPNSRDSNPGIRLIIIDCRLLML